MTLSDKEEKKKKIRERNLRNWKLFHDAEHFREQVDIGAPEIQTKRGDKKNKEDEKLWSARLVTIKNRLNDSKTTRDDMWNRFAGTSGGGGMGR